MDIVQRSIPVRELAAGYSDDDENGVVAYDRRLDVRPAFQREFVYKDKQRDAVIESINSGYPLNVMYWADVGDGRFEVIDGQQRTISICQYVTGEFSINDRGWGNLTSDEQDRVLDYELTVYVCSGSDREKLDWFQIVNIAGERLSDQELRNAVYSGTWVSSAKVWFSRTNGPADGLGGRYLTGDPKRQAYLETAIQWAAGNSLTIEGYMAKHQNDTDAEALWRRFKAVIGWVEATFTRYRNEMKGIDWGSLYDAHHRDLHDPKEVEAETARLMADDDVTRKRGIYEYILTGDEKHLNIRRFTDTMKRGAYERQDGLCPQCGEAFEFVEMDGDHIDPWSEGGKTVTENCQMLCKPCNRRKGSR